MKRKAILKNIFTRKSLSTAEYAHMAIITDEHELAADTHVDTADKHDAPRQDAPEHQVEQGSAK